MPNWKERLENYIESESSGVCSLVACDSCPFNGSYETIRCILARGDFTSRRVRLFLFRHVLTTVKDFTDRDEIRARIAEMLDDDAREKFLGKPEPDDGKYYIYTSGHYSGINCDGAPFATYTWPEFHYIISERGGPQIGAFHEKDTACRVLAFLNGKGDGGA